MDASYVMGNSPDICELFSGSWEGQRNTPILWEGRVLLASALPTELHPLTHYGFSKSTFPSVSSMGLSLSGPSLSYQCRGIRDRARVGVGSGRGSGGGNLSLFLGCYGSRG